MTKVDYLIFCERFQEELQRKLIFEPISKLKQLLSQIAYKVMCERGMQEEYIVFDVIEDNPPKQIIEMEICVDGLLEKSQIYIN